MTDDPIEAAIEAAQVVAIEHLWDRPGYQDWEETLTTVREIIRAAAPILIRHGRGLAAQEIREYAWGLSERSKTRRALICTAYRIEKQRDE